MRARIMGLAVLLLTFAAVSAQKKVTVEVQDDQISQNLDLKAVAIAFGESKNLEEFEQRLNDDNGKISNLDLNNDGEVDYLRVVDQVDKGVHHVVIQAVLGKDNFKDIATVNVEKDEANKTVVEISGDRDIYGDDYVLQPVYLYTPSIFSFLWAPGYMGWYSPYYWGYFPPYFHRRPILAPIAYRTHIVRRFGAGVHYGRGYAQGGSRVRASGGGYSRGASVSRGGGSYSRSASSYSGGSSSGGGRSFSVRSMSGGSRSGRR